MKKLDNIIPGFSSKNMFTLFRFVWSKYRYATGKLTEKDIFLVNFITVDMLTLAERDPQFLNRNLEMITQVRLSLIFLNREWETQHHQKLEPEVTRFPKRGPNLAFSPRAYIGLCNDPRFRKIYQRAINTEKIHHSSFRERFIGVGYKDKGTCRKPHINGELTWQEYATINEGRRKTFQETTVAIGRVMVRRILEMQVDDGKFDCNFKGVYEFLQVSAKRQKILDQREPEMKKHQIDLERRAILGRESLKATLATKYSWS